MHQGRRSRWLAIRSVYLQRWVTVLVYVYSFYLRCEDIVFAILSTRLPMTTTIAGKWLNNLTFHDDNKCITANGQMMINVGLNKICYITIIYFVHKNCLEVLSHSYYTHIASGSVIWLDEQYTYSYSFIVLM